MDHVAAAAMLGALVRAESPSGDTEALARCAAVIDDCAGTPAQRLGDPAAPCLLYGDGAPRVLLLGHYDTVWPVGTLATMPFVVEDGRARGPGTFDMKAGVVQGLMVLDALNGRGGVGLLLTADEETGSELSRPVIERLAAGAEAVLVLEPSADGALKTERAGVATYEVRIAGRAAHAGLEPEAGANAAVALAHVTLAAGRLADGLEGATVTPTVARAGDAINVVAAGAVLTLDARSRTIAQQEEIGRRVAALRSPVDGTSVAVATVHARPPLEASASAELFARAARIAAALGLDPLRGAAVGGGSDGSLTAALGVPTLDGLGAVGGGAHAATEHVVLEHIPARARLVAALAEELLGRDET